MHGQQEWYAGSRCMLNRFLLSEQNRRMRSRGFSRATEHLETDMGTDTD